MSLTRSFIILLAGFFFVSLSPASAQIISSEPPNQDIPGTVACFDYYHFDSVQANISTDLSETVSGATLGFTGTLANDNDYPLVDASVYVKIFRRQTDEALWHKNGHLLIDQFFAAEHVDIPAKGEKPFTFEWSVPAYAQSGDYFATTYVVTQKKFNLLGLSFTKDVNGNTTDFSVQGEQTTGVTLDPNTATVGTTPANLASFINHVGKDESAPVTIKIRNTTTETKIVPVTYTLRQWDGVNEDAPLDTKTESVTLTPKETKILSYTVTDTKYPVYYLTVEAEYKDAKSIENIRFVRDGVDRARINFPAVTAYPLEADKQATVFSCLHNSGTASRIDNGKLVIEVKDARGKTVDSHTYEGPVTGAMMAVKHDFTPKETLGSFTVNTSLYQDGNLVDESVTKYDCNTLGGPCPKPNTVVTAIKNATPKQLIWTIALSLILLALLWKVVRKKETRPNGSGRGRAAVWFLALALGTLTLGQGQVAEGKSVVRAGSDINVDERPTEFCTMNFTVASRAEYEANAFLKTGTKLSLLKENDSVLVGSTIVFEPGLGDVSWFFNGKFNDSPFGYWKKSSDPLDGDPDKAALVDESPDRYCKEALAPSDELYKEKYPRWGRYMTFPVWANFGLNYPDSVEFLTSEKLGAGYASLSCSQSAMLRLPFQKLTCLVQSEGKIVTDFKFIRTDSSRRPAGTFHLLTHYRYEYPSAHPSVQIPFLLNAVSENNPPSPPKVTPVPSSQILPASGLALFRITAEDSTDPDGDMIRYGFDWNMNGVVDEWGPTAGYVPSGSAQEKRRTWTTIGTKPFQVLAQDENGNVSVFTKGQVIVTPPASTSAGILQVCDNACGTGSNSVSNLILKVNENKTVFACYAPDIVPVGGACVYGQPANGTTWKSIMPSTATVVGIGTNRATVTGKTQGSTQGEAGYIPPSNSPLTASFGIQVEDLTPPPPPPSSCACDSIENAKRCKGSYTWTCANGVSTTCQGEKNCGSWVEVAP